MWLKKIWIKLATPEIAAELQDHLDQSRSNFGNYKKIINQCLTLKKKNYYQFCFLFYFFILGILLWLITLLFKPLPLTSSYLLIISYLWTIIALLLLSTKTISKIFHYFGKESTLSWIISLSFAQLLTLSLVIFYDLDGLEIIMENATLLLLTFLIGLILKKYLKKIYFILAQISLIITALMAITQKPFNLFGQLKCLFLTPDYDPLPQTFSTCQQINLTDSFFIPFWLISLISLLSFLYFIYYLFFQNTLWGPKIFISSTTLALIIIPSFFYDFNNYHRLNLIFYQPQIIKIYRQTLNRDPEPKDLDFYASHETYLHLDRIFKSLKESAEYQQKYE